VLEWLFIGFILTSFLILKVKCPAEINCTAAMEGVFPFSGVAINIPMPTAPSRKSRIVVTACHVRFASILLLLYDA